jgi:Tol biopolymer transport system component
MPDVREVYEMVTKQTGPKHGAMERQFKKRDRKNRNRKIGAFAAVACIVAIAVVAAFATSAERSEPGPSVANKPNEIGQTLSIVDVGSGTETAFIAPTGASQFDFTLDGSMVSYIDTDENGTDQVFVMDADGSNQRQLTQSTLGVTGSETPPQWSPDGSKLAYWVSLSAGDVELFVVRVGDGVSTRVTHEPNDVFEGGWATDGSFVFSISNPSSAYPLLARSIDIETGETATIARDVSTPEVSPDGTQIAFDSYFHPQGEAWLTLINIDGTGRRRIQQVDYNSGSYPKWSPDSSQIAYVDPTADAGSGTYVYDVATAETRFVTSGTIESWVDDEHILVS